MCSLGYAAEEVFVPLAGSGAEECWPPAGFSARVFKLAAGASAGVLKLLARVGIYGKKKDYDGSTIHEHARSAHILHSISTL